MSVLLQQLWYLILRSLSVPFCFHLEANQARSSKVQHFSLSIPHSPQFSATCVSCKTSLKVTKTMTTTKQQSTMNFCKYLLGRRKLARNLTITANSYQYRPIGVELLWFGCELTKKTSILFGMPFWYNWPPLSTINLQKLYFCWLSDVLYLKGCTTP